MVYCLNNIYEKISRWLSRRNARVSRNQGKFAPSIAPSRACTWFENKRFDWPSVSFSFATFLSINLISNFSTQFQLQLSALISSFCTKKKFLHCLGLIDMLSANQPGEIFSCILFLAKLSSPLNGREVITYLLCAPTLPPSVDSTNWGHSDDCCHAIAAQIKLDFRSFMNLLRWFHSYLIVPGAPEYDTVRLSTRN